MVVQPDLYERQGPVTLRCFWPSWLGMLPPDPVQPSTLADVNCRKGLISIATDMDILICTSKAQLAGANDHRIRLFAPANARYAACSSNIRISAEAGCKELDASTNLDV